MTALHERGDSAAFDADRLQALVTATIEGTLAEAEYAELAQVLAGSREARTLYRDLMQLDAGVDWHVRGRQNLQGRFAEALPGASCPLASPKSASAFRRAIRRSQRWSVSRPWAGAALVLAALGVGLWLRSNGAPSAPTGRGGGAESEQMAVAKVAELSTDCRWFVENRAQGRLPAARAGDTIRLTSGRLRIDFDCGATITLRAPAALQVVSGMQARAVLGTLTAHVGPGAEGFTIDTPRTSVVDLGTDFGIDVSQHGSTDVVVFTGAVDLHYDDTAGLRSLRRLHAGEGARVSGEGTASRILSIVDSQFSDDDGSAQARAPVISAVRDNIRRGESWHYYEIVRGGMREDVKAFVDRKNHEWNGMGPEGMPAYLVGGDYVKTFNDDKWNADVRIRLTLERPAAIYVLYDNRVPAPDWLREEFTDTGDDIGMDGGGYTRDERVRTIDKGAGVSIDDVLSIWRRKEPAVGTVQLGALIIGGQKNNMYGIVAVALDRPLEDGANEDGAAPAGGSEPDASDGDADGGVRDPS